MEINQLLKENKTEKNEKGKEIYGKDKNGNIPPLLTSINNNIEKIKLLIDCIIEDNSSLGINEKNKDKDYMFLKDIYNDIIKVIKLLLSNYANNNDGNFEKFKILKNYINGNINENDNNGNYPLLEATDYNNPKIDELSFDYDIKNISNSSIDLIKLNEDERTVINKTDINKQFFNYLYNNDISNLKSIVNNSIKNKKILDINKKDENGNYPLLIAIKSNNTDIVKLLINYANENKIGLEINEKDEKGKYPLLEAIFNKDIEVIELLIDYAKMNNKILKINEKGYEENYPVLSAVYNNNKNKKKNNNKNKNNIFEIIKLLIDYANKNDIVLEMNEKNKDGWSPILEAINNNNIEIIKLLIDYANDHKIILKINEKNKDGWYPVLGAIHNNNNIEMIKLLID